MPIPARPEDIPRHGEVWRQLEEVRRRLHEYQSLREVSMDRIVAMLHNKHGDPSWLLDHLVYEPFFERARHIKAQILAGLVLRDALLDRAGFDVPYEILQRADLKPLIDWARVAGIISEDDAHALRKLNKWGLEAKHHVMFRSRL